MKKILVGMTFVTLLAVLISSGCKTTSNNDGKVPDSDQGKKNVSLTDPANKKPDTGGSAKKSDPVQTTGSLSGVYTIIIQGFTGKLVLEIKPGGNTGTIFYNDWGKGLPIPISNLSINGNKIYFERIVETKEDLIKYGGNRYFKQQYFGEFRENGKRIKGYFRDSGAETNWEAIKK